MKFYLGRDMAEQWIKEGKNAVKWTKLSCRTFKDNQARWQLFALSCNRGNFLRRLALPKTVCSWNNVAVGSFSRLTARLVLDAR